MQETAEQADTEADQRDYAGDKEQRITGDRRANGTGPADSGSKNVGYLGKNTCHFRYTSFQNSSHSAFISNSRGLNANR